MIGSKKFRVRLLSAKVSYVTTIPLRQERAKERGVRKGKRGNRRRKVCPCPCRQRAAEARAAERNGEDWKARASTGAFRNNRFKNNIKGALCNILATTKSWPCLSHLQTLGKQNKSCFLTYFLSKVSAY